MGLDDNDNNIHNNHNHHKVMAELEVSDTEGTTGDMLPKKIIQTKDKLTWCNNRKATYKLTMSRLPLSTKYSYKYSERMDHVMYVSCIIILHYIILCTAYA